MLPALAEARIIEFNTQVRPCLPDNLPSLQFDHKRSLLSINGLYRHGFLLTPAIVEEVLTFLSLQKTDTPAYWPCLRDNRLSAISVPAQHEVQTC